MTTINLETIKSGIRVTARQQGRTLGYRNGQVGCEKELVGAVMADVCSAHKYADGTYDMTQIKLNDAAQKAMA